MIQIDALATSTIHIASRRVAQTWPWYIIRAAGFTAAGLIVLLMISGIGQVTGLTYKLVEPLKAWAIHKALAIALCFAIAIHVTFLLIDHFVRFNVFQIFIPFLSSYNNKTKFLGLALGGIAVVLGILAMYGVAIIVASSLGWLDTKKGAWRKLHYLSYLVVLFIFIHALYAGSDLRYGTFRTIWIILGLVVGLAVVLRLLRAGSLKNKR